MDWCNTTKGSFVRHQVQRGGNCERKRGRYTLYSYSIIPFSGDGRRSTKDLIMPHYYCLPLGGPVQYYVVRARAGAAFFVKGGINFCSACFLSPSKYSIVRPRRIYLVFGAFQSAFLAEFVPPCLTPTKKSSNPTPIIIAHFPWTPRILRARRHKQLLKHTVTDFPDYLKKTVVL